MNTTIEFFQTDGAEDTLCAAIEKFTNDRAKHDEEVNVTDSRFVSASPALRSGRWVEIEITFESKKVSQ